MRLWKSWIVTKKDLSVFKKNRYILYSLVALPLILGVVLPIIFVFSLEAEAGQLTRTQLIAAAQTITDLGSTYFVIIPTALASIIGSYSFVGEKVEHSLEPLLATPTTDGELLLGKSLAAFIPCMGVTYIGVTIFSILIDGWSYIALGTFLVPNTYWAIIIGVLAPLVCVLSVEANVIISSRVNDVRAAQQLGSLVVVPIVLLVVFASTGSTIISKELLALIMSAVIGVLSVALFYLSKITFQREEILTKWK